MGKKKKSKKALTSINITKFLARIGRPITLREICRHFGVKDREKVRKILAELEEKGEVIEISSKRFGLTKKMNLIVGHLSCHPDGYGFVIPENGQKDIFISPRNIKEAMHGDRVLVRVEKKKKGKKYEGEIIRILERRNKHLIGVFETDGQVGFLLPEDERFTTEIIVPLAWAKEAASGQMVIAEIVRFPTIRHGALAKIIEVLGDESLASTQSQIVVFKYNLPTKFSDIAEDEAEGAIKRKIKKEGRKDLRRISFFTIDGEMAKDFDDAVAIKKEKNGYRLYVSIADVSYYVKPHSALDEEAYQRGNSIYFPDRVLPMLPFSISQGICSLNPGEDRLTITVEMRFNNHGELIDYDIYESVIQSKERLTYYQVQQVLNGEKGVIKKKSILRSLNYMAELAEILRKRRIKRGSLDFDLPEPEVFLDILGHPSNILRTKRWFSHQIIEEFMIAANETIAMYLTEKNWPMVYRVHDRPSREKIETFAKFFETLGYSLPKTNMYKPIDFQKLLKQVKGTPHEFLVNRILLRSLKQARYSPYNIGHFGLASNCYTHFTSPIRRYADLMVHRILKKALKNEMPKNGLIKYLDRICQHISERERIAMEAEREIVDRLRIQFMLKKIGEEYNGTISGVNSFGFFVELNEVFVEGLVKISSLHDDYYFFDEKTFSLKGKRRKKTFRLGDQVRVRVINVNPRRKEIELHLIDKK
ncbi:MAG TPA: ribonuclease R [Candidatus Desulfofervidus auxilii]|uniref:Ribonuclease R n=1 Tax=Desulfofervidus auxilii TaxID=1621989 RepID=A0A7C0Y7V0_DESA2|nr:ribonuclease R [Candidatus Desulfofervidus auxilii]